MLIFIFTLMWGFLYEVCVYRRFKAIISALSQGYRTAILTYLILFRDFKKMVPEIFEYINIFYIN